jgi:hypothetical protein
MSLPVRGRPGPAPAVTERAWPEMPTGRGRWVTAPLTGTSSGQTGPPRFPAATPEVSGPRTPIHPLCPHPPAGAGGLSCVSAGTSREDFVNVGAGAAVVCATGHRPEVIFDTPRFR